MTRSGTAWDAELCSLLHLVERGGSGFFAGGYMGARRQSMNQ